MIDQTNSAEQEQIAYYRARAEEYDEWWLREGRYDRGPEWNARWTAEIAQAENALAGFRPAGDVLELAGGTGLWTQRLAGFADSLTVVDAAPETLALNKARLGSAPVQYIEADLFAWQPTGRYDAVFFSFWLSHVPPERFEAFWNTVRKCLRPGGRVFFLDSQYAETSTAADHQLEGTDATTVQRQLKDGREYRIVKVFYQAEELAKRLMEIGWQVQVQMTPHYFLYGLGTPD